MANKYFNKQVAESRKPLASGSMVKAISEFNKPHNLPPKDYKKSTSKELKALEGFRKVSPKPSKGDKMKEYLMRKKKYAPEFKKNSTLLPKSKKTESPERIKRQADYMKKHGKNEPRRKTLSVTNSYKKEVEGLK
jgi:hypothetical protein